MAGSIAKSKAARKGNPVLLAPIMRVEIVSTRQFIDDMIAELSSRRGHIETIETQYANTCIIHCLIPLAETFGYATAIRSLTQGRANHTMEPYGYQEVSAELADQLLGKVMVSR